MLGHHADLVGDQVGAVEAHPELADPGPDVGVPQRSKKKQGSTFGSTYMIVFGVGRREPLFSKKACKGYSTVARSMEMSPPAAIASIKALVPDLAIVPGLPIRDLK